MMRKRSQLVARLRNHILDGVHLGTLRPGARLASVRELARECAADPRVVRAAYRQLEAEGLVELRARSGVYLAPSLVTTLPAPRRRTDWIVSAYHDGVRHGIAAHELPEVLRRRMTRRPLRVACAECNHDQIESLRAGLGRDYGFETVPLDCGGGAPTGQWLQRLREMDLLLTTQFHAHQLKDVASQAGVPLLSVRLSSRFVADLRRRLASGPVYVVLLDGRLKQKLLRLLAPATDVGSLRIVEAALPDCEAALEAIPRGAPTFVTHAAQRRLPEVLLPGVTVAEVAALTAESVRALLSFIVRANEALGEVPTAARGRRAPASDRRRMDDRRRRVVKVDADLRNRS